MPTYVYETIPQKPRQETAPLRDQAVDVWTRRSRATRTTGAPVRRVIAGGIGVITQRAARVRPPAVAARRLLVRRPSLMAIAIDRT